MFEEAAIIAVITGTGPRNSGKIRLVCEDKGIHYTFVCQVLGKMEVKVDGKDDSKGM